MVYACIPWSGIRPIIGNNRAPSDINECLHNITMLSNAQYLLLKASNMPSSIIINALIIAVVCVSNSQACMSAPSYVAPPDTPLKCIPCEHESEDWSWGLKAVWFLIRIITHLEYSCCKVETEVTARHFKRYKINSYLQVYIFHSKDIF